MCYSMIRGRVKEILSAEKHLSTEARETLEHVILKFLEKMERLMEEEKITSEEDYRRFMNRMINLLYDDIELVFKPDTPELVYATHAAVKVFSRLDACLKESIAWM
ncbi:hypothetical protein [Thermofilum sp.]|uniref:hypothetical protein n=1 Tax=Thermofilum sp. TaxID=1961369 RepID=UPI00317AA9EF